MPPQIATRHRPRTGKKQEAPAHLARAILARWHARERTAPGKRDRLWWLACWSAALLEGEYSRLPNLAAGSWEQLEGFSEHERRVQVAEQILQQATTAPDLANLARRLVRIPAREWNSRRADTTWRAIQERDA